MIDYTIDADGVAHIVWNNPDGPVNIKSAASMAAFVAAVDKAIADPAVKGAVIGSAKRDFLAGGDIDAVYSASSAQQAIDQVSAVGACLRRMETSGKPFVAAINGSALGGGLEVALACHHRVAADDARLRIGLPESTLGLIPGAGGTQRLPRLIGVKAATRMMQDGKPVNVQKALAMGIVDAVTSAESLLEVARQWALDHPKPQQPWDKREFRFPDFEPQSREGRWFFFNAWPAMRCKSPPGDIAPTALLHVLAQGLERGIDAGLVIEARYFGLVAASSSAKNRIRTQFMGPAAVRKQKRRPTGEPLFEPKRAGVVGAGLMGGGIALVCARAGLQTVLMDTNREAAERGKSRIGDVLAGAVERGLMSSQHREEVLECIHTSADMNALQDCDIVVEAVVESAEAKAQVFAQIEVIVGKEAIIASNTSTLSITSLASSMSNPNRFIGLHFFAPVDRMALVEVILGKSTSARTLAHSLDFLKLLGKSPIVVNDGPGFYTSRVVAAYTREALTMLHEGVSPVLVDNAALAAGMSIGPLAMADLTSYDLLTDIIASLAREGRGTACESEAALQAAKSLVAAERLGRKGKGGVYDYQESDRKVWSGLAKLFPILSVQPSVDEVSRRLLHAQSLETIHAMDEGIAEDPLEIDLAAVLGWSYPAWRGGVLAHIDDIGVSEFVQQCDALAARHGARFRPPPSLRERAVAGQRFHSQ